MNTSFSLQLPNLQLAWDSTSLGTLKECPRKYELSIFYGWEPHDQNPHLTFGLVYHAALETYDHAKSQGKDHEASVLLAVRRALGDTWNFQLNRPWNSDNKYKNRLTLVRTVVWYLEHFKEDQAETVQLHNGKPAVELSWRFETDIKGPTGEKFLLCGHLDRVVNFQGDTYILDRKTSKNSIENEFFEKFSPDNQMSMYDLAGRLIYNQATKGIIIDAAQVLVTGSRFRRGFTHRTNEQRNEYYYNTSVWLGMAGEFARKNYWPMNDKSCSHFGGCPFRGICNKSPLARNEWLQSKFHKRVWDPLKIRGDI